MKSKKYKVIMSVWGGETIKAVDNDEELIATIKDFDDHRTRRGSIRVYEHVGSLNKYGVNNVDILEFLEFLKKKEEYHGIKKCTK